MNDASGKPEWWIILEAGTPLTLDFLRKAPKIRQLTDDQKRLSINSLWSHPSMVVKLADRWTPERAEELRSSRVGTVELGEPDSAPYPNTSQGDNPLRHYFYFSKRGDAEKVGTRLATKGFEVTVRRSADDTSWLTVASSKCATTEKLREDMEALAAEFHGEYDGWELAIKS